MVSFWTEDQRLSYTLKEVDVSYEEEKMCKAGDDYGPLQKEAMELRKRVEQLHLMAERVERKFKPVLRSVPESPEEQGGGSPRLLQAELTETLGEVNRSLSSLELRLADMITRCEL